MSLVTSKVGRYFRLPLSLIVAVFPSAFSLMSVWMCVCILHLSIVSYTTPTLPICEPCDHLKSTYSSTHVISRSLRTGVRTLLQWLEIWAGKRRAKRKNAKEKSKAKKRAKTRWMDSDSDQETAKEGLSNLFILEGR